MEVEGAVPGVTEAGENAQLAPVGSPAEQDSATALLKLFFPVTIIWKLAGFPAETVLLLGLPERPKLGAKTIWLMTVDVLAAKLESPP
jgi:hypothetical protein